MNIKQTLSCLAASLLLAACTSENLVEAPSTNGTENDGSRREVLLSFKNKLSTVKTKADAPIATEEENYIRSLDIYVFGSESEATGYTFQELYYYRDDASTVAGDWAHSFNLTTSDADNSISTALLKLSKGLYVKLYCVVNRTKLYATNDGGAVTEYTDWQPITQTAPGALENVVTAGVPTEVDFLKLHSSLIDPAGNTEDDILSTPLPMVGYYTTPVDLTDFSSSARTQLSFKLNRMVARFDVVNNAAESKFTLESISMVNGRKGSGLFPVKAWGTAPADLITYPEREVEAATQVKDNTTTKGAFYVWPSPLADDAYLVLKGKYAANKTENLDVTYKVPFKQEVNGVGSYIEVSHNHRYTIAITKADTYHLDFELKVDEWSDEGDMDKYDPNKDNELNADPVELITAGTTGAEVQADGNILILAQAGSKFSFEMSSSSELEETVTFKEGSVAWLVEDTRATKAVSVDSIYTYKVDETQFGDMSKVLPATISFKSKITGRTKDIVVVPAGAPTISLAGDYAGFSTFDAKTNTVTMYNVANQTVKLHVVAPTFKDVESGSSAAVEASATSWMKLDQASAVTAEADYTLTLQAAQSDGASTTVDFTSALSSAKTTVTVKLVKAGTIDALAANSFGNGGTANNTFDLENKKVTMEGVAGNTFTLKVVSPKGVDAAITGGNTWLEIDGAPNVIELSSGKIQTTVTCKISDATGMDSATKTDGKVAFTNKLNNTDKLEITVVTSVPAAPAP